MDYDPIRWTYAGWAEAFAIFARHSTQDDHVSVSEYGDNEVYVGVSPASVPASTRDRLDTLGWRPDAKLKCFRRFA